MTELPDIPINLSTNNISETARSNIPRFPNLPNVPGMVPAVQNTEVSELIKSAIPESVVNKILNNAKTPDGTVDLDKISTELENIYNKVNRINENIINGLQIQPTLTVSNILSALLPEIPVPNIPSPAAIRKYIDDLIEKKKTEQQQAVMLTQKNVAAAEELPFTTRQVAQNNTNTQHTSCVITESGSSVEEAISKAEFRLRRVELCTGETTVLRSIESNGVYTVTMKID